MNQQELQDQLETLIDAHGLPALVEALAQVAHEKAEHVRSNWQDTNLATLWALNGDKLARLATKLV